MKFLKAACGIAALVMSLGWFSSAMAQTPIVIKFSHVVTENTPKGKAALKFKELAEKYTDGKVKVEVYPNSTLYKDGEEMEALQLGAVQLLAPSTGKFAPLGVKEFEALDLPFIFPDLAAYNKIANGPVGKMMLDKLEAKGVKGMALWDNGFYVISANKPLILPTDLRGLKIRISGSKVADAQLRLLGASPQIMAFSELYQALQTGVVDGAENTPSNYLTQKLYEVQKYMNLMYHSHLAYAVIANKKFWDGLPPDIRTQLDKAMAEATEYNNSISVQENVDALDAIRKSGKIEIHEPTKEERQQWMDAMMPVYKTVEPRIGKDMIDLMMKEVGTAPAK
jgi:C4-dicarboxylate-binding protein DctP